MLSMSDFIATYIGSTCQIDNGSPEAQFALCTSHDVVQLSILTVLQCHFEGLQMAQCLIALL